MGEPWEDGRLHSAGELWVWGGALAVIALYCALNVEGAVSRLLPGRTRAVRGTVRNGQVVVAAGDDPRGPLRVDLRIGGTDPDGLAAGMEGRTHRVLGVGRLGLGAASAAGALISITMRFATGEPEESGPAQEGATA